MRSYGAQSVIAPLRRAVVRQPDEAFGEANPQRQRDTARPVLSGGYSAAAFAWLRSPTLSSRQWD